MRTDADRSASDPVEAVFDATPEPQRSALRQLRQLILDVADDVGAGPVREELKWGQPSYTAACRSTSTAVRLATTADHEQFGLFFHCQTSVVPRFREAFPDDFTFDGNRGVLFRPGDDLQLDRLRLCVEHALTYRRHIER